MSGGARFFKQMIPGKMTTVEQYPFRAVLSFSPLLEYIEKMAADHEGRMGCVSSEFLKAIIRNRELNGRIDDVSVLERHSDLVRAMMHLVFSPLAWERDAVAAVVPFSIQPVFISPLFRKLFLDERGRMKGEVILEDFNLDKARVIRAYMFILRKFYGLKLKMDYPVVHKVEDPETGLDVFFQFDLDFRFVDVRALKKPQPLTPSQREMVVDHIAEPEVIREIIPPEDFELQGFSVIRAVDVTESVVISSLQRDLIDQESLTSKKGFLRIQQRLRTLFRRPDLIAGLAALHNDQVLLVNSGCELVRNCIFADSRHISKEAFRKSAYAQAVNSGKIVRVPDIEKEAWRKQYRQEMMTGEVRSCIVAPLHFEGRCVGTLDVGSPLPGDMNALDELVMAQLQPIFAIAVKKALDELEHQVQEIIKQKCTAIHPTVEWAFRKAAFKYLDRMRLGHPAVMEPIVFKNVYSLYGISDIRGSSIARNRAIQGDLDLHLDLGRKVLKEALKIRPMLTLQELDMKLESLSRRIESGLGTGDERLVVGFLKNELEPVFVHLEGLGSPVDQAIANYKKSLDPVMHTVYNLRRDFEESVAALNDRLTTYLDRQEARLQATLPHYFERHRTDGVDYIIYTGRSLVENGHFNKLFLKELRIWQLKVACGMAWHTEQMKSDLKVPLDTTHLILVQDTPLSIRFRYDEKRFDVDRAYDVRQEIIKSRLDKATVKGTGERLTQPGKIAIVYSQASEALDVESHLDFLQHRGYLEKDYEYLELESLQGVQGLKALRVKVRLDSDLLARRADF